MDPAIREIYEIAIQTTGGEELQRAAANLRLANRELQNTRKGADAFNTATASIGKGTRNTAFQIQNMGYQVSDFFVQISGGQNAMRAFSQQLPQILTGFRGMTAGMALGIAGISTLVAALPALITLYESWTNATMSSKDALEGLNTAISRQKAAAEMANDFQKLTDGLGAATLETQKLADQQERLAKVQTASAVEASIKAARGDIEAIARTDTIGSIIATITPLGDFADTYAQTVLQIQLSESAWLTTTAEKARQVTAAMADFESKMGITFATAQKLDNSLAQLEDAKGLRAQSDAAEKLLNTLIEMSSQTADPGAATFAKSVLASEDYIANLNEIIRLGNAFGQSDLLAGLAGSGQASIDKLKGSFSGLQETFRQTASDYADMQERIASGEVGAPTDSAAAALKQGIADMSVELFKASPLFDRITAQAAATGEQLQKWQDAIAKANIEAARIAESAERQTQSYRDREEQSRAILQNLNNELGLLQAQQEIELRKLQTSEAFVKATRAQQDAMLKAAKAAQQSEMALARVKKSIEDSGRLATALAGIAGGQLVGAFNQAAAAAGRISGAIGAAINAMSRLASTSAGIELETKLANVEKAGLAAGESMEKIRASQAGVRAEMEMVNALAPKLPKWMADAAGNMARLTVETQTYNLELIKTSNAAAIAARDAAGGAGGGGGISDQAENIKAAMQVINQALQDSLTPAEEARQKQQELAAAMELASQAGLLSADQIERLGRYMSDLASNSEEVVKQLKDITESGLNEMFDSLVDGAKSVEQAFADMVVSILRDIAKMLLSRQVQSLINLLSGSFGSIGGLFNTPVAPSVAAFNSMQAAMPKAANTNADAINSAFYGRVRVVQPQQSIGANGLSASRQSESITVNVNNTVSDVAEVRVEETNQGGEKQLDIFIERKVREVIGRGSVDRVMAQSYGLRRRPG
jgi:hypothetical protein